MDVRTKSRHAERVGEKKQKYWDYRECGWVIYSAEEVVLPKQPSAELTDADEVTAVEPVS